MNHIGYRQHLMGVRIKKGVSEKSLVIGARVGHSVSVYADSFGYALGWSEKHKNWKMQKYRADSEPRHSTDFRTIFRTVIG